MPARSFVIIMMILLSCVAFVTLGEAKRAGDRQPNEPVMVITTIPVLRDFAEQIGGPHVRVSSLMTGLESEHTYAPKPSDVLTVKKADLLIQVGIGLEVWVTSLVKTAANPGLRVVTTSAGVAIIRDREEAAQAAARGDRHPGNPHIWLDPENAKAMIRHITDALISIDAPHAEDYRSNQASYLRQLDRLEAELVERLKPIKDRRILVYHPAWPYFARRFGFRVVDEILTQPGAEPSAHHLQALVKRLRTERIKVIVSEPQLNPKIPDMLARESGARVVLLTALPGGLPGTETYLDLLRHNVSQLADALS